MGCRGCTFLTAADWWGEAAFQKTRHALAKVTGLSSPPLPWLSSPSYSQLAQLLLLKLENLGRRVWHAMTDGPFAVLHMFF